MKILTFILLAVIIYSCSDDNTIAPAPPPPNPTVDTVTFLDLDTFALWSQTMSSYVHDSIFIPNFTTFPDTLNIEFEFDCYWVQTPSYKSFDFRIISQSTNFQITKNNFSSSFDTTVNTKLIGTLSPSWTIWITLELDAGQYYPPEWNFIRFSNIRIWFTRWS